MHSTAWVLASWVFMASLKMAARAGASSQLLQRLTQEQVLSSAIPVRKQEKLLLRALSFTWMV